MKKKLFLGLLAAAAVTFTACQKDEVINEVPQNEEISFSTYLGRDAQTKGSIMTLETDNTTKLKETGFGVFAFLTEGDFTNSAKPNLMYNQEISWSDNDTDQDTSDDIWDYSVKKYWPDVTTQKVSFYAYAPYVGTTYNTQITGFSTNTAEGVPTLNFTVPSDVSDQIDLLYATPATNYTQSSVEETNNKVNLTFNHALSRIGFKAKTIEGATVTISEITLSAKFATSATCNIGDGTFESHTYANTANNLTDYTVTFNNNNTATGTTESEIKPTDGYIMIIPQDFTTNKITISVEYNLVITDNKLSQPASIKKVETGTVGINFIKSNAYTLLLNITPSNPIEFGVISVDNWSTPNDTEVQIQ